MTKSLMISIRPEHAVNILNGKKTLELRTWIPKDYVGWVYVYVSKGKPYLNMPITKKQFTLSEHNGYISVINRTIPFRFWFDEYIKLERLDMPLNHTHNVQRILPNLCLNRQQVIAYGKDKDLYAWHIKKLEVFFIPKGLYDFYVTNKGLTYKYIKEYEERTNDILSFRLKKPPQRSVWVYGN